MKKVLLVDDDAVIVEVYRERLLQCGYDVTVAQDGLAAMSALHNAKPDLVVLDIMMPKFSGFEVLEFIRSEPQLKDVRVVVLSNYYFNEVDRAATIAKADEKLSKSDCSPERLVGVTARLLSDASDVTPRQTSGAAPAPRHSSTPVAAAVSAPPAPELIQSQAETGVRHDFLKNGSATLATLRQLNEAFIHADSSQAQAQRLTDFYRKVHYVTAMAGLAACEQIAMLSSVFEALLLELYEKPANINPSSIQTIAYTLDFFRFLFAHEEHGSVALPAQPKALVVDDDPVSNRAVISALSRANVRAIGLQDPLASFEILETEQFDLLLLDLLMPGMDGFQLCVKVRALPRYRTTPIIFVSGHADFQNRMRSVLSGGNDLIAKPIFPIELAVKAVTHLLRSQLPESWMRS